MIRRIYSDLPRFKVLEFSKGFNVVLADKSPGATDRQTRNRAGKSSLLEIIHFLLGSKCDKESIFRSEGLQGALFGMEFDLGGRFTRVERSGSKASPVTVAGDFTGWPVLPTHKNEQETISNENWKAVLGRMMFGLGEPENSHGPSFRSLISYFARRDSAGGMTKAAAQSSRQQLVDQQVNISFLIGLDWVAPHAWLAVREREKQLEQLKKSAGDGALGPAIGSASAIKSDLVIAQERGRLLRESVTTFRVEERYHELEAEASKLTQRLAALADDNVLDRRYLSELERASAEEKAPAPQDLEVLYKEAGVLLPGVVTKRFEDVKAFHESVVRNRRSYLLAEMQGAKERITERDKEKSTIDSRRAEIMGVLKSAGALEHFTALQGELTKAETHVEVLRHMHETAEALESGTLKLKGERTRLLQRLRQSYTEEEKVIEDAILAFSKISSGLYEDEAAGTLTITPTENGPEFDSRIPGAKSKGVNNMQIFCFDMMLMLLSLKRGRSPGFLVHDSHLFDGVDERQKGKALALGKGLAEQYGFQYIVTMNTDDVPKEVPAGFSVEEHALPIRLTDATEDGGLFGFRFD